MMSTKRKEENGKRKRLMAAEAPFVTNRLFNLKHLIGFRALLKYIKHKTVPDKNSLVSIKEFFFHPITSRSSIC